MLSIGYFLGVMTILVKNRKSEEKSKYKIKELFISIFDMRNSLIFSQRVHQYVQFSIDKYFIILVLDKREISIFENDVCIANSSEIDREISDNLIFYIEKKFNREINYDVVDIGGYLVSQSYLDQVNAQYENSNIRNIEEELNLDDILDKINISGIESLNKKEMEFLKKMGE
jgi:hypothetical protein